MLSNQPVGGPSPRPAVDTDVWAWRYGVIVVALGMGAILAAVLIVLWRDPAGAGSVLGVVISPIAAIIGAYFGIQASHSAAKDAQNRATTAEADKTMAFEDRATALAAMDPQAVQELAPRLHFNT